MAYVFGLLIALQMRHLLYFTRLRESSPGVEGCLAGITSRIAPSLFFSAD
jgi:hypothetical protein